MPVNYECSLFYLIVFRCALDEPVFLYFGDVANVYFLWRLHYFVEDHPVGFAILQKSWLAPTVVGGHTRPTGKKRKLSSEIVKGG